MQRQLDKGSKASPEGFAGLLSDREDCGGEALGDLQNIIKQACSLSDTSIVLSNETGNCSTIEQKVYIIVLQ
jgi:hypothetical protein